MDRVMTFTAFAGTELIAGGDIKTTVLGVKARLDAGEARTVIVFEDQTGLQIDFDLRGGEQQVVDRLTGHPHFAVKAEGEEGVPDRRGPGRPRLGVVSREVSLLPRHWEWLASQKGGASAALRRLIDQARKRGESADRARQALDAAGKFMWAMAGNLPGFEEASRALYAGGGERLAALAAGWPADVRDHALRLATLAADLAREASGADKEVLAEPGAASRTT
jgi:uncharacterized protein